MDFDVKEMVAVWEDEDFYCYLSDADQYVAQFGEDYSVLLFHELDPDQQDSLL